MTELFGLPYDRWEGYAAERSELLDFIRAEGIKNVVFVTGDLHANFIADVSQGVFTDPSFRAREFLSGPVAQATLFVELVQILGSPAAADGFIGLITALIRPDCLEPDAFAYGIVEVDGATRRLSVSLKDGAGAILCSAAFDPE
jgi:alkaline phosphatase D